MYWQEEGKKAGAGAGKGPKMGQLTLGKRPARMGIRNYALGATIPSKGFFFYINKLQHLVQHCNVYVQYKKKIFLTVQVQNKSCDRGLEPALILDWNCTLFKRRGGGGAL